MILETKEGHQMSCFITSPIGNKVSLSLSLSLKSGSSVILLSPSYPHTRVADIPGGHTQLFMWMLRWELRSLFLHRKHSQPLNHFPSLPEFQYLR